MLKFLFSLTSLILLCLKKFYAQASRAEADGAEFKINQETMKKIVDSAVSDWHRKNSDESSKITKAWDESEKN